MIHVATLFHYKCFICQLLNQAWKRENANKFNYYFFVLIANVISGVVVAEAVFVVAKLPQRSQDHPRSARSARGRQTS